MRLLVVLLLFTASPLAADDFPALYSVNGVAANDVLNIRQAPDPTSPIIGTLAPDAAGVEVVDESDGWASVNTGEALGYAAARFLSAESGSPWYQLEQPISCSGTEPFWSFEIDTPKMTTTFTSATSEKPRVLPIQGLWPGNSWSTSAAVAVAEGMAVLRHEACNDGMSERGYGIAIDIFLNGGNHRISGCCTMIVDQIED